VIIQLREETALGKIDLEFKQYWIMWLRYQAGEIILLRNQTSEELMV